MAERIVNLAEVREARTPHIQGRARCMLCRHEWQAVAPVGVTWITCPNCESNKGHYLNECMPPMGEGFEVFDCDCGSDLLHLIRDGNGNNELMCANCGITHRF